MGIRDNDWAVCTNAHVFRISIANNNEMRWEGGGVVNEGNNEGEVGIGVQAPTIPLIPERIPVLRYALVLYCVVTPILLAILSLPYTRVIIPGFGVDSVIARAFTFLVTSASFVMMAKLLGLDDNRPWAVPTLGVLMLLFMASSTELLIMTWLAIVLVSLLASTFIIKKVTGGANNNFDDVTDNILGVMKLIVYVGIIVANLIPGIALGGQFYLMVLTRFGLDSIVTKSISGIIILMVAY